ncbi:hypothetical protein AGMMS49944_15420 [Spirochaetia bacterium]|nr:hypothetical protein AGMMS49944_15420 [Spirochaetia bacterium]
MLYLCYHILMDELAVKRSDYIEKALLYLDKPVIKVITDMRRCGKSAILRQICAALGERGVSDDRILYLNFESQQLASLANAPAIYQHVSDYAKKARGHLYIMLDEVQYISDWERAVSSFRVDFDCDIYITGSNASLLSGDLSTLLGGRFVSIPVYPLSFREFLEFTHVFGENAGKSRFFRQRPLVIF